MRVIVTAGGTEEPVDGVRRLTNTSTGATGAVIARELQRRGADVLLVHAERAAVTTAGIERETFVTHADLAAALMRHLSSSSWDAVIHLAAVSDYSVDSVEVDGRPVAGAGKIPSGADVVLRLRPNPKLIDELKAWSRNPDLCVVGFKLTNDPDPAARTAQVRALLERGTTDLVVHNDLTEITDSAHPAEIWGPDGPVAKTQTKGELAELLVDLLTGSDGTAHSRSAGAAINGGDP